MDAKIEEVLAEYDARAAEERGQFGTKGRDELLLRVGPETGQLLNILARESGAKTIVEVGTSYGYSAVWLAEAARHTGGKVISLDLIKDKQDYARERLARAGLADYVEFRTGNAIDLISGISEPIDFVLVDLWKDLYAACFDALAPKLAPGAILVADNMIEPAAAREQTEAYKARVRAFKGMESILLPVGSGIEISRYAP